MIIEDCIEVINNAFPENIYKELEQECPTLTDIMTIKKQYYMISNYDYKLNWNNKENIFKKYINTSQIYLNFKSPNLSFGTNINTTNNKNKKTELEDFRAIFFMRQDCDKYNGGNLEIYEDERRIISIPYQKNTFVIIKNIKNINNENKYTKKLKCFITYRGICFNSMRYIIFI
jgi:hypothetical protein